MDAAVRANEDLVGAAPSRAATLARTLLVPSLLALPLLAGTLAGCGEPGPDDDLDGAVPIDASPRDATDDVDAGVDGGPTATADSGPAPDAGPICGEELACAPARASGCCDRTVIPRCATVCPEDTVEAASCGPADRCEGEEAGCQRTVIPLGKEGISLRDDTSVTVAAVEADTLTLRLPDDGELSLLLGAASSVRRSGVGEAGTLRVTGDGLRNVEIVLELPSERWVIERREEPPSGTLLDVRFEPGPLLCASTDGCNVPDVYSMIVSADGVDPVELIQGQMTGLPVGGSTTTVLSGGSVFYPPNPAPECEGFIQGVTTFLLHRPLP